MNNGEARIILQLRWIHLLLLWLAYRTPSQALRFDDVYSRKDPHGALVNQWLTLNAVPEIYSRPITHPQTQQYMYEVLMALGYVTRPGFTLTKKGAEFAAQLGDDWKTWPTRLPYSEDNEPVWEQAKRIKS